MTFRTGFRESRIIFKSEVLPKKVNGSFMHPELGISDDESGIGIGIEVQAICLINPH
jgi:hypothetical protein